MKFRARYRGKGANGKYVTNSDVYQRNKRS